MPPHSTTRDTETADSRRDTIVVMEDLARNMVAADRLIDSARHALRTFYFKPRRGNAAVRFLRDPLDPIDQSFSTGGASVAADLFEIDDDLERLHMLLDEDYAELRELRDEAATWLSTESIKSDWTFGSLNPITVAAAAQQLVCTEDAGADRGKVLAALVLRDYVDPDWPKLPPLEEAHPYVAHRVFQAAQAVWRRLPRPDDRFLTPRARAAALTKTFGTKPQKLRKFDDPEHIDTEKRVDEAFTIAKTFSKRQREAAFEAHQERARRYLHQQNAYADAGPLSGASVLSYDPVGACFALDILVRASLRSGGGGGDMRRLADHHDLVITAVRHVLTVLTPVGSLPYGRPFSYTLNGSGAFATSFAGLAALAHALRRIFEASRATFYENAGFLEELLAAPYEQVDRLFSLPQAFIGTRRESLVEHKDAALRVGALTGWSTDRALSGIPAQSWVTKDVFLFAVHVRRLMQEVAQLGVVDKYGAEEVTERLSWPYSEGRSASVPRPDRQGKDCLLEPDQRRRSAGAGSSWHTQTPVAVLHNSLSDFMPPRDQKRPLVTQRGQKVEKSTFLLFGPPGTAKSSIARSIARRLRWHFLELTPSDFVADGLPMIEQRSRAIFEDLEVLTDTVVLFDELDSLLVDRESLIDRSSILSFAVPAMLPKLQALTKRAKKQRLVLIFATNFYDRLDPAMARLGRVDARVLVLPPNKLAREVMLGGDPADTKEPVRGAILEEAVAKTPLNVFEELRLFRKDLKLAHEQGLDLTKVAPPRPTISPQLYSTRLPMDRRDARATTRLAFEVAEVCGRLLGDDRHLLVDDDEKIAPRLRLLSSRLKRARRDRWAELCAELEEKLT